MDLVETERYNQLGLAPQPPGVTGTLTCDENGQCGVNAVSVYEVSEEDFDDQGLEGLTGFGVLGEVLSEATETAPAVAVTWIVLQLLDVVGEIL